MLMERFVLQHDQLVFDERKAANDADRYQGYGHMLGVLGEVPTLLARCCGSAGPVSIAGFVCCWPQDVPFGVINVIFVTRLAARGNRNDRESFTVQLLILLTSVATVVYKAMLLRDFPAVWHERGQLQVEKRQLDERFRVLSNASAKPNANLAAAQSSEMAEDTASESGVDDSDAETAAAAASVSVESGRTAAVAKPATALPSRLDIDLVRLAAAIRSAPFLVF
jgi:hypothetical protein